MTTGKTPVANGSRVPIWPAFFISNRCLTSLTTSREVIPSGLSTMRRPSIPFFFIGLLFLMEALDQLFHMNGIFNGRIELKHNFGSISQSDPTTQFFSNISFGAVQTLHGTLPLCLGPCHTKIDSCKPTIFSHHHPGDGDETNTRIFDRLQQHLRDFFLDQIRYFLGTF